MTGETKVELADDDVTLIEEEHGPLELKELCKLAVFEYAQQLRRRKLFDLAGRIRFYHQDDAGDESE